MTDTTRQLNAFLPVNLARRVKADAAIFGVTLNEYSVKVYESFLSKPVQGRRIAFERSKRKIVGRKVTQD